MRKPSQERQLELFLHPFKPADLSDTSSLANGTKPSLYEKFDARMSISYLFIYRMDFYCNQDLINRNTTAIKEWFQLLATHLGTSGLNYQHLAMLLPLWKASQHAIDISTQSRLLMYLLNQTKSYYDKEPNTSRAEMIINQLTPLFNTFIEMTHKLQSNNLPKHISTTIDVILDITETMRTNGNNS